MSVEFHSLGALPRVLSSLGPFSFLYVFYHYHIEIFKRIPLHFASYLYRISGLQKLLYLLLFCGGDESLGTYGGGIIRQKKSHEKVSALDEAVAYLEYASLYYDYPLRRIYISQGSSGAGIYILTHYSVPLGRSFLFSPATSPFSSGGGLSRGNLRLRFD